GFFAQWINSLFGKLIIDSRISFNLLNLPELSLFSVLGFLLITILLLNYLIVSHFFARLAARSKYFKLHEVLLVQSLPFIGLYIYGLRHGDTNPAMLLFPLGISMAVAAIN